jgi:hypothetical protein
MRFRKKAQPECRRAFAQASARARERSRAQINDRPSATPLRASPVDRIRLTDRQLKTASEMELFLFSFKKIVQFKLEPAGQKVDIT